MTRPHALRRLGPHEWHPTHPPAETATHEVTSARALKRLLKNGSVSGVRVQGVDLSEVAEDLFAREDLDGMVVLGGTISPEVAGHLVTHGAAVFPSDPHVPVDCYRAHLYTAGELYSGLAREGYLSTPDARAYAWSRDASVATDPYVSAMRALHDDAITDALTECLNGRQVVAIMGGHGVERGHDSYLQAALLGFQLGEAGYLVITGGGPGAMEAANLGAAAPDEQSVREAVEQISAVPSFREEIEAWASVALQAQESWPIPGRPRSVGVPTWFYGHEPPNVFAQAIAKYFSNALREDVLLAGANAGIVVLPGAAGTVQEIFQAITPRYYASDPVAPLILVGREYWSQSVPVWPAIVGLGSKAGGSPAAWMQRTHLIEGVEEVPALLAN